MNNDSTDVTFCPTRRVHLRRHVRERALHYARTTPASRAVPVRQGEPAVRRLRLVRRQRRTGSTSTTHARTRSGSSGRTRRSRTLTARIKYWYWSAAATSCWRCRTTGPNDPLYLEPVHQRSSTSPTSTQNRVKVTLDWAPLHDTGWPFEYIYKDNNYNGHDARPYRRPRNEIFANRDVRHAEQVAGHAVRRLRVGQVRRITGTSAPARAMRRQGRCASIRTAADHVERHRPIGGPTTGRRPRTTTGWSALGRRLSR